jgi:hypothetical protein
MYDPSYCQRSCSGYRSIVPVRLDGVRHCNHGICLCEIHGIIIHGTVATITDGKNSKQFKKVVKMVI